MLTALLAPANQDQNMFLPPWIYQSMFNTVTSLLISECVKLYPSNPQVIDIVDPFVRVKRLTPTGGIIKLPDEYRNILGAPGISAKLDGSGECSSPAPTTAREFDLNVMKAGCQRRPVIIKPQSEFDVLTTSTYKKPTYRDPIGKYIGQKQIQICPFDISAVDVMYVVQENTYTFGYIMQPDDTYINDPNTTVESEWASSAFEPIFKALNHLYAAYSRDQEFQNWAMLLSKEGIL